MKFDYKKLVKEYTEWVARETRGKADYVPKEVAEINESLGTAVSEGNCRQLGSRLSYLANWYSRRGVVLLSQGDDNAWSDLRRAAEYEFWNFRIRCRTFDREKNKIKARNLTSSIINAGQCGVMCLALNAEAKSVWMAQRLQQSRVDGSIGPWEWPTATPRLAIALHRYLAGQKEVSDLESGIYKDVFEHWNNSGKLQEALLAAAEYHANNLRDRGDTYLAEFTHPPIDIFPAELVSIQRVREKLGLETPEIDHPLMKTPLANPPRDLKFAPDELLTKVIEKVGTIIPDL